MPTLKWLYARATEDAQSTMGNAWRVSGDTTADSRSWRGNSSRFCVTAAGGYRMAIYSTSSRTSDGEHRRCLGRTLRSSFKVPNRAACSRRATTERTTPQPVSRVIRWAYGRGKHKRSEKSRSRGRRPSASGGMLESDPFRKASCRASSIAEATDKRSRFLGAGSQFCSHRS